MQSVATYSEQLDSEIRVARRSVEKRDQLIPVRENDCIDTASKPVRGFEGGAALVLRLEPGHLFLLALEADASQDPLPPVLNDLDPSVPTTTGRKTPTNRP